MSFPEGSNDRHVVTMDFKTGVMKAALGQPQGIQLNPNGLCPANVSPIGCPVRSKVPHSPTTSHEETDPPRRRSIDPNIQI